MFELHVGAKLDISSKKFLEGFFITGNPGQGKSVTLSQIILEVIKNKQSGLFIDPYGDLAKDVLKNLTSLDSKNHVIFTDLDTDKKKLDSALQKNKFVIAAGHLFEDGNRKTFEKGVKLLNHFYKQAKKGQWLIIDEALSFLTDELFEKFMENKKIGVYSVFSASDFFLLSKEERRRFAKNVKNFIIFKPRNINSVLMAKERTKLDPENIKAIKQYHFQLLMDDEITYHQGVFPIEKI